MDDPKKEGKNLLNKIEIKGNLINSKKLKQKYIWNRKQNASVDLTFLLGVYNNLNSIANLHLSKSHKKILSNRKCTSLLKKRAQLLNPSECSGKRFKRRLRILEHNNIRCTKNEVVFNSKGGNMIVCN